MYCFACSLISSFIFLCRCCLWLWEQKRILPQMSPSLHLELMEFMQVFILPSEPGWSLRREAVWLLVGGLHQCTHGVVKVG